MYTMMFCEPSYACVALADEDWCAINMSIGHIYGNAAVTVCLVNNVF